MELVAFGPISKEEGLNLWIIIVKVLQQWHFSITKYEIKRIWHLWIIIKIIFFTKCLHVECELFEKSYSFLHICTVCIGRGIVSSIMVWGFWYMHYMLCILKKRDHNENVFMIIPLWETNIIIRKQTSFYHHAPKTCMYFMIQQHLLKSSRWIIRKSIWCIPFSFFWTPPEITMNDIYPPPIDLLQPPCFQGVAHPPNHQGQSVWCISPLNGQGRIVGQRKLRRSVDGWHGSGGRAPHTHRRWRASRPYCRRRWASTPSRWRSVRRYCRGIAACIAPYYI